MKQQARRTSLGLKLVVPLVAIAGLSMGNKGCEDQPTGRLLKMDVELGSIKGRSVRLPNGEVIDFPYVANALFYRQVMNHNHFVISNEVPTASLLATSGGKFKTQTLKASASSAAAPQGMVSSKDISVLDAYGLLKKTREDASSLMSGTKTMKEVSEGKTDELTITELPACLYEAPQAILGGEVISFEATWGIGLGVGYGPGGELNTKVGGSVDFKSSKLEIGLRTDDPLTRQTFAIGDGVSHKQEVSFAIDFLTSAIGLDFFYNTPITDVIRKAMTMGLDQISAKYISTAAVKTWNEAWESRVIYDPEIANGDTHIAIRGGNRAGIQNGDVFQLTNLHYKWEGAPCASRLKYKIGVTINPIATATVVRVGDNVSVAKVDYMGGDDPVRPGAQVKLLKLNEPVEEKSVAKK